MNEIIELLFFIVIYTILIFIWSYTFAKKKQKDATTNAFLLFLGTLLLWMVLSISNFYEAKPGLYVIMQSIYWVIMLNIAIVFLNFIYALLDKKRDFIFYIILFLNTSTIIIRHFLEINYLETNFWRLNDVKIASIMAIIFTLPMICAIVHIIIKYKKAKKIKTKKQLKFLLYGITLATLISIFSEYICPVYIPQFKTYSFMYIAILTLVLFLVRAVVKEKFLNAEMEYIYEQLFVNSIEGIILIDEDKKIVSVNNAVKDMLGINKLEKGMAVNDIIKDYDYYKDNIRYEITQPCNNEICFLSLSQDKVKIDNKESMKLLQIIDMTSTTVKVMTEKNILAEKSMRDELTGLYNKRYFNDNFLGEDNIIDENTIIMFIDIDNFKEINDNYGHLIGDAVLKLVAQSITNSIRTDEIAIRYGGDEFLVILQETNEENAYRIAERIRINVSNNEFINTVINKRLTLSIGLSKGNSCMNSLVEEADNAMYYSKIQGRDQCTIYNKKMKSNKLLQ